MKDTCAKRLRAALDKTGLTQAELSRRTNIPKSAISQYLSGAFEPKQDRLELLARVFGVPEAWLMGFDVPNDMPAPITTEDTVTFPVIGEVAAGYEHIMTEDWSGETIEVPASYLHGRSRSDYFCLRVIGDSMYPLYLDGDRVLVLKTNVLQHSGDIGVVRYNNDMATLKKVEYAEGEDWLRLVPLNLSYPPQTITGCNLDQCSIIGVPKLIVREV